MVLSIDTLPEVLLEEICSMLDGASLVAFAQAAPSIKDTILQPRHVRTLTFTCDTDDRTVVEFSQSELCTHVQSLRFKNCLALRSDSIVSFAQSCSNLRDLDIVGCVVEPAQLFPLLAETLKGVRKLEWTLHEHRYYVSRLTEVTASRPKLRLLSLEEMYVEVAANSSNVAVLKALLRRCHSLKHLHIHAVRKEMETQENFEAGILLMDPRPGLATFTHTCELVPVPEARRIARWWYLHPVRQAVDMVDDNASHTFEPEVSRNFVCLTSLLHQDVPLRSGRNVIVGVEADMQEPNRFLKAAAKPEHWKGVRSVSLSLTSPRPSRPSVPADADRSYLQPMQLFLGTCLSHVTELNLTSFHFDCGGFPDVGSALTQLRALALPPCALNTTDSLKFLLRRCKSLEELNVSRERCFRCGCCDNPLELDEDSFGVLNDRSALRKLSLNEMVRLKSLHFLRQCRVRELRVSLDSLPVELRSAGTFFANLSQILRTNSNLRGLTIAARCTPLGHHQATALAELSTLQELCVLSEAFTADYSANTFVHSLVSALPQLVRLHVHYTQPMLKTITWIRQRHPVGNELNSRELEGCRGVLLDNRPCVGCSRSTLIGLPGKAA